MPFYRRGGVGSRGAIACSSGLNTSRKAEFVILRSPENITDVDPDTEDDWDREYRPKINKNNKPAKKVARLMGPADDVESLVDLEDYSPRGPSRNRRGAKVDPSSNISIPSGRASFVESPVGGGCSPRPSEEDSGDDYTPLPSKASKVTGRSCANKEVGKARARADTIVCASSTGRRSAAQKTESTQQRKQERTASYEAKTAERVAEIAAKRAPHLVALARINAEAEKLREQLRLKKQEREIMERVWGVVRSREKAKIGVEKKTAKPKAIARIAESENEGPPEISSSDEVERKMSLLREELQEESEGWNSLFDESEKMSGVDSIEVGKPAIPRPGKRKSGRLQATSETGDKSQNQGETRKSSFEENTGGELAESTGSEPASDSDSLFGNSKAVTEQGRRSQFGETKKSLAAYKNSQHEKRGTGDSQPTREEGKRQRNGRKRKYRFEENTNDEIAGQKGSRKTSGFPVSRDSLFDDFGPHSGQGNGKKLKGATKVLGRPRKESEIHSRGALPTKKSLRLHDEEVANKKRVGYDKGGVIMKKNNHLPDWRGLGERVGEGHRGLAASELVAAGVGSGEIYSKPSSPLQGVGGGGYSSIREVQVDLGENKCLEHPDGERGGHRTGDELERVNEEIDLFLRGCGANSTSLHDRQEGYDVYLFDPLPEMPWGKLVGVGDGGDSSTTAERAITNPIHMGPSAQERELQSVKKRLEKDLDVMDWDKAEAEFLKFDGAVLHPAIEDQKDDVGLSGVGGQVSGIENGAGALKPQPSPSRPHLPRDAPGGGTRGKVLACLEQGREGHRLGRPEDWVNTSEGGDKVKICNPACVHNPARKSGGRVRSRPYSMKEISEYSLASLFETYKRDIEEMEMKATKSVGPSVVRGDDRGRTGESKSQAQGAGGALEEKPKAGVPPDIHRGGVYEPKAGDRRVYTLSEWSDCARNGKRQQGEAVWDVTARPRESGKIAEQERAEGEIAGATAGSLELARQKREGSGFVGTDASCPEDGEIIEPEQRGPDHISRDVHRAKLADDSMRSIEAGCDRGGFMAKALDPYSAVFPGETAKLYRVELTDGSMGYVLAEVLSGEWSMVFMTDAPGDGHGKTRGSPPQKEFDGGLLSEAGEMAWESPQGALESISQERARSESHETWGLGLRHGIDGRNVRTAWSRSPALKRNFQESSCGGVEEEEQRDQESKRQKLDTQGHHPDNNDWD